MIHLVTGLPGAGKTLRGVQLLQDFIKSGRPVFHQGIDGLDPSLSVQECDARLWQELPDNSVVIVDEAQKVWPSRRSGDPPPDIRALSEHRHRGFDFILLTQHPTMLDKYVRTLVGCHQHVLRQFGSKMAKMVTWAECYDDPQSPATRVRGTESYWKYDPNIYRLYKSATHHTVKTKLPFKLKVIPVLLVMAACLAYYAYSSITSLTSVSVTESVAAQGSGSPMDQLGSVGEKETPMTVQEYIESRIPRIASDPGSAPIFDGREPVSKPELYCVATEEGRCICHTEQATRYQIEVRECLAIVKNGIYNPYREPMETETYAASSSPARLSESSEDSPGIRPRKRIDAASIPAPSLIGRM